MSLREWDKKRSEIIVTWELKAYTMNEIEKHNTIDDFWVSLNGFVYNLTEYLPFHPGGIDVLLEYAGKDVSIPFKEYHPWVNFQLMLEKCLVGYRV